MEHVVGMAFCKHLDHEALSFVDTPQLGVRLRAMWVRPGTHRNTMIDHFSPPTVLHYQQLELSEHGNLKTGFWSPSATSPRFVQYFEF